VTAIDDGKVPPGFPRCRVVSRVYSDGGRPVRPYYDAREVWEWFRKRMGSFDPATGEPWRCSACVFYHFCRIGRCVAFLPVERFTGSERTQVFLDEVWSRASNHESGLGFVFSRKLSGRAEP